MTQMRLRRQEHLWFIRTFGAFWRSTFGTEILWKPLWKSRTRQKALRSSPRFISVFQIGNMRKKIFVCTDHGR
jgi:hypothetical protein